jgi:hypothetical protein
MLRPRFRRQLDGFWYLQGRFSLRHASAHPHQAVHESKLSRRGSHPLPVFAVLATLVALLAGIPGGAPVASAQGCPDVMFIGARGSGEPLSKANHGLGRPLYEMATQLGSAVSRYGEHMGMLGVVYSADSVSELIPSVPEAVAYAAASPGGALALYYTRHVRPYTASINNGVKLTIEAVHAVLSPDRAPSATA